MTAHSRILAWRIPWAEEPGGLQSMGSQRVGNDWAHTYKIPAYWADFLKKFRVNLKNQKQWDSSLNTFRIAQRNTVLFSCEICCKRSIPLEQFVLIIPFICKVCSHSLCSNDKSTKADVEACGGYTEVAGNLVKGEWASSTHHVSLELLKFKVRATWVGHPATRSSVFMRTIECKRLQQKWWKAHSGLTEMGNWFPFIECQARPGWRACLLHKIAVRPRSQSDLPKPPHSPHFLAVTVDLWFSVFQLRGEENGRRMPSFLFSKGGMLGHIEESWSPGCRVNAELCFTPETACLWSST